MSARPSLTLGSIVRLLLVTNLSGCGSATDNGGLDEGENGEGLEYGGPGALMFPLRDRVACTTYPGHPGKGCDLAVPTGTDVLSPVTGRVDAVRYGCADNEQKLSANEAPDGSECNGGLGNSIRISADDGHQIVRLMHLKNEQALVVNGEHVCAGQLIAHSGASGRVRSTTGGTGAHLHIDDKVDGVYVYPGGLWLPVDAPLDGCVDVTDDAIEAHPGCSEGDGAYCGSETLGQNPRILYTCSNGVFWEAMHCPTGCDSRQGPVDECASGDTSQPAGGYPPDAEGEEQPPTPGHALVVLRAELREPPLELGYAYIDGAGVWTDWDAAAVRFCQTDGTTTCGLPQPPGNLARVVFNLRAANGVWLCVPPTPAANLRVDGFELAVHANGNGGWNCEGTAHQAAPDQAVPEPQQDEPVPAGGDDAGQHQPSPDEEGALIVQADVGHAQIGNIGVMYQRNDGGFSPWGEWSAECATAPSGRATCSIAGPPTRDYTRLYLNFRAAETWACEGHPATTHFDVTVAGWRGTAPADNGVGGCNLVFER